MKTVLAPNAPWPKVEPLTEKQKFKHKQKPIRVIAPKTKIKKTDENFERWLESERKKDAERM